MKAFFRKVKNLLVLLLSIAWGYSMGFQNSADGLFSKLGRSVICIVCLYFGINLLLVFYKYLFLVMVHLVFGSKAQSRRKQRERTMESAMYGWFSGGSGGSNTYQNTKAEADRRAWERYQNKDKEIWHNYQANRYAGTRDGEYHKNMSNYYRYK